MNKLKFHFPAHLFNNQKYVIYLSGTPTTCVKLLKEVVSVRWLHPRDTRPECFVLHALPLAFSVGCLLTWYLHSVKPVWCLCPCEAHNDATCFATCHALMPTVCNSSPAVTPLWHAKPGTTSTLHFFTATLISVASLELCILIFHVWNLSWFKDHLLKITESSAHLEMNGTADSPNLSATEQEV